MKNSSSLDCFLAVDIGATSGREVVCTRKPDGKFEFKEIHRFPNAILNVGGKYYWDIYALYASVIEGLRKCASEGFRPMSIGIDTWGVDFGFAGEDGTILGLPRAYRDPYTAGAPEEFYNIIPKERLYDRTGIQIMDFNSIFQLYRQSREGFSPLKNAAKLLFIPDLLSYMLTGEMVCEYTVASTSQLLNPYTGDFDDEILSAAGVGGDLFPRMVMPGTVIGELTDSLALSTGLGKVKVVAVAGLREFRIPEQRHMESDGHRVRKADNMPGSIRTEFHKRRRSGRHCPFPEKHYGNVASGTVAERMGGRRKKLRLRGNRGDGRQGLLIRRDGKS